MIRPLTEEKIVFDPDNQKFYVVSQGVLGSPRPFRRISKMYREGTIFSVDEERVIECTLSRAGQSFGTGSILSEIGRDAGQMGVTEFEDLPPDIRADAIDRARKWCVGILEATEVEDMSQDELNDMLDNLLNDMEEEVESDVEDVDQDDDIEITPVDEIEG